MTRAERMRRTAKLCLNCLRNCAYLRAAANKMDDWHDEQFWIGVHNNFLDIAVLEWCKIFADHNGKHFWKKSVADHQKFLDALLDHLRLTEDMFDDYIKSIKRYRDKFVAHLDKENRMDIPNMAAVIKSSQFLYQHLYDVEDDCGVMPHDAPPKAVPYFREFLNEGNAIYAN